ncbi:YcnI family protein [Streptomyces sp. JJ36]|uniref:YcnI family copper-binding membrane protein n=1 Tax=Streptomyces sp. JJ36 TaxID=2736645 RepID=UPI001F1607CC|nr:YcnI family protein [Streptomyces sp. JJ36]MCF6522124.1 YcnI family protein [Streptomyces sp. JJ36]
MTSPHTTLRRRSAAPRRLAVTGALAAAAVLTLAGPAAAHVTVDPDQAERGGYSTVTFKVPNERDDASTVRLEVAFPTDQPLASVMPQPVPGWDVQVTRSALDEPVERHGRQFDEAVTRITWTGGEIEPGQFQQFPVSLGPLPEKADRLVFKALQTYDSDEIVRWIEEPKEGAEPEHPAPVLQLTAPAEEEAHGGGTGPGDTSGAQDGTAETAGTEAAGRDSTATGAGESGATDTTARVLGGIGVVAGVAGVAFGILAGRRRSA